MKKGARWIYRPALAGVVAVGVLSAATADAAESRVMLDLPAQPLARALETLATQTRTQLLYPADLVRDLDSAPLQGEMSAAEALRTLLADTGLAANATGDDSFTLVRAAPSSALRPVVVTAQREDQNYQASTATAGGKVPVELKDIPNSVSVLTRERMDDQGWTDVDHALAWATGVDSRPNDSAQSQYWARGFSLTFAHDGVPSFSPSQGYQELDLAMYDRVEILRGPAGVMQGSGEPAGMVNLVRKRPTNDVHAAATASVGSWNNYRSTVDVSTPLTADKTVKGRFVGTFTDRDFFYDDAHSQKWFGYGIVEYSPTPDWTFSYSAAYQDDHNSAFGGVPVYSTGEPIGFDRSTNTNAPWSWANWATHEEKVEAERRFANGWTAKVAGSWREQELDYQDGFVWSGVNRNTNTATYGLRDQEWQYYRKSADAFVNGPFRLFGREHSLLLGSNLSMFNSRGDASPTKSVTWNIYNAGNLSQDTLPRTGGSETRVTQYGQYGQVRLRVLDPVQVILGGRNTNFDADSRTRSNSAFTPWRQDGKAKNEFTPYAGTVIDVTRQTSLYGSYSEIFVPQTSLTYSGAVVDPRTGWQTEVGVKNTFLDGKLSATLAAFVLRDVNRAISDPAHSGYYLAAGEVESKGWEAEVTGSPMDGLKLVAGYTYMTNQYVNDRNATGAGNTGNTFQPWEPRHSLKAWGVYTFADGPLEGFSFGSGVIAKSQTYSTQHLAHQNAYAVFDAQIGYQLNNNLQVTLTGNNLFDNDYWAKMLSTTNNMYGEPRSFTLAVKASM